MAEILPKIEYGSVLAPTTIEFDYPALEDEEIYDSKERVATSISGRRQVSVDHVLATRSPKFSFVSQEIFEQLQTFFTSHACFGRTFTYYDATGNSNVYELKDLSFRPRKIVAKGNGFIWEIPLSFIRVVGAEESREEKLIIDINEVQTIPLAVTGLLFTQPTVMSAKIFMEARRKTDAEELVSTGVLSVAYREASGTWDITSQMEGDDTGVDFTIASSGQVLYTAEDLGSTGYSGSMTFKTLNLGG